MTASAEDLRVMIGDVVAELQKRRVELLRLADELDRDLVRLECRRRDLDHRADELAKYDQDLTRRAAALDDHAERLAAWMTVAAELDGDTPPPHY